MKPLQKKRKTYHSALRFEHNAKFLRVKVTHLKDICEEKNRYEIKVTLIYTVVILNVGNVGMRTCNKLFK